MRVIAVIPARAGSKGIPHKNLRALRGKPLLVHAIEQARAAARVQRVIVSTDSPEYAALARECGAEVPFLRPASLATDEATDLVVFEHLLEWFRRSDQELPDAFAHVRATYPNRSPGQIDEAVDILARNPHWTSVRSVVRASVSPAKMWYMNSDGELRPVLETAEHPSHSVPRQGLPVAYAQNACIDVIRVATIAAGSMTGAHVGSYVMASYEDIDSEGQLLALEAAMARTALLPASRLVVDIDGVVCTIVPGNDYMQAQPQRAVIDAINACHRAGHEIVLCTARGTVTGIDWTSLTREQLAAWGVRYHELHFGKPAGDFYVDDKALTPSEFLRMIDG